MQDAARAHWLAFDNAEAADMENLDFGFHDYESAMENGDILVLSGFHILPNAGGWNDQFVTDAQDLLTYLKGLAWARGLKEAQHGDSEVTDGEGQTSNGIHNAGNWQNFL